ncbi:MAG TPA: hypothetical protein DCE56_44315 [Cyanobacteria bacterium UBA8553]|nr:hypothetical protein [Cyanobacteria bacterium UBA8553]HAJ57886.1 hypothetical protein [Cyanobacteria bacterium UBA8543]
MPRCKITYPPHLLNGYLCKFYDQALQGESRSILAEVLDGLKQLLEIINLFKRRALLCIDKVLKEDKMFFVVSLSP